MKLWLIQTPNNTANAGCDVTVGLVIRAETPDEAWKMASENGAYVPQPEYICTEITIEGDSEVIFKADSGC